jgi:hypothetical protein
MKHPHHKEEILVMIFQLRMLEWVGDIFKHKRMEVKQFTDFLNHGYVMDTIDIYPGNRISVTIPGDILGSIQLQFFKMVGAEIDQSDSGRDVPYFYRWFERTG